MSIVLFIAFLCIFLYPGTIAYYVLKDSLLDKRYDVITSFYLAFSFSVLYWVSMSTVMFSIDLLKRDPLVSIIVVLGVPVLFLLIKKLVDKKLDSSKTSSSLSLNVSEANKSAPRMMLPLVIIFFLVAIAFEAFHWPLPAGFDRNKHLSYVIWFIWKRTLMRNYIGTAYNNFYPVGMHMAFALLLIIAISPIRGHPTFYSPASPEGFFIISGIFVFTIALIIAMYPIALYFLLRNISRNKNFIIYVLSSSLLLLGYIVITEPIHMLLGNLLIPFTFFISSLSAHSRRKKVGLWLLLVTIIFVVLLIHIYAAIYHILTVLSVNLANQFNTQRLEMSNKAFLYRILSWMKSTIRSLIGVVILSLSSLGIIFLLYPNYIFGIYQETIRVSKVSDVLEDLSRYSLSENLWNIYNVRSLQTLPLYVYEVVKAAFYLFVFIGCLAIVLCILKLVFYLFINEVTEDHPNRLLDENSLMFLVFSAIYVFLPIVPKFGITEEKGLYLLPIIIGILLAKISNGIGSILGSVKRRFIRKGTINIIVFLLLITSVMITVHVLPSTSRSRVYGYIQFAEVRQLAQAINLNLPAGYTVVYPDGSRQMELLILETLVKNRIVMASISLDLPQQIEFVRLYKYCYVWKRGAYYLFKFDTPPKEVLRIIIENNIGAIIGNPFYTPNYQVILGLFPTAHIIRISPYYTLVVLV